MIVCGDVSHYFRCCTEAGSNVFVALNALLDESNFDRHEPANGSANIKNVFNFLIF